MISIKIIATGDLKESYLRDAIKEYQKRLGAWCKIEEIILKEEKLPDNPTKAQIDKALECEEKKILEKISSKSYVIAMCVEGKQLSSEEFAQKLDEIATTNGELAIIVGSSFGLSDSLKRACDFRMSVSIMTLTHQMLRVWLVEIIYRCLSITRGGKYHK